MTLMESLVTRPADRLSLLHKLNEPIGMVDSNNVTTVSGHRRDLTTTGAVQMISYMMGSESHSGPPWTF